MEIDKSIRILVDRYIDTYVVCGGANYNPAINITREDYEAFQAAIATMRKYQKIEQIMSSNGYWCNELQLRDIRKVLEDGNDE